MSQDINGAVCEKKFSGFLFLHFQFQDNIRGHSSITFGKSTKNFASQNFDLPPLPPYIYAKSKKSQISLAALAGTFRAVIFPVNELKVGLRCSKNDLK